MSKTNKKSLIYAVFFAAALGLAVFVFFSRGKVLTFGNQKDLEQQKETANIVSSVQADGVSPFTSLACEHHDRRPLAVMISGDSVARPLSGLSSADLVINMPVITDSITRLMAVYVCEDPQEIGSIRSARTDYIPFVEGWKAIYGHWGGSHFALDKLKTGVVSDLDALTDLGGAYFRKAGIPMPHNGFTSMPRLLKAANKLGYSLTNQTKEFFPHLTSDQDRCQAQDCSTKKILSIGFPGSFKVEYKYDPSVNAYYRWRGNTPEMDANNNRQVEVKVVAIIKTDSHQIEGQYNEVDVIGSGAGTIYQNGLAIEGKWQKNSETALLRFLQENGEPILLVPGKIWIEVVQTNQKVDWQ